MRIFKIEFCIFNKMKNKIVHRNTDQSLYTLEDIRKVNEDLINNKTFKVKIKNYYTAQEINEAWAKANKTT